MFEFSNNTNITNYASVTESISPVIPTRRLINCQCGSDLIKVVYNGEFGSIECMRCSKKINGFIDVKGLKERWNVENSTNDKRDSFAEILNREQGK